MGRLWVVLGIATFVVGMYILLSTPVVENFNYTMTMNLTIPRWLSLSSEDPVNVTNNAGSRVESVATAEEATKLENTLAPTMAPKTESGLLKNTASRTSGANVETASQRSEIERRDPTDGRLAKFQLGSYTIHMYSAFWDDRWELESDPVIRVLVVVTATEIKWAELNRDLHCVLFCDGEQVEEQSRIVSHHYILKGHAFEGQRVDIEMLTCQPAGCKRPDKVTFALFDDSTLNSSRVRSSDTGSDHVVPIEPMKRTNTTKELATCRPLMYAHADPYELVEWFELQKIFGVDKVILYNDSVDAIASDILRHYEKEGYLDLWQIDAVHHETKNLQLWQPLTFNDCFYRHMYDYKHIMCIDTDEMIVPTLTETLPELVRELDKYETLYNGTNLRVDYSFLGATFLRDRKNLDPDQPQHSVFLRSRKRYPHSSYRKPILNQRGCLTAFHHWCLHEVPYYKNNRPTREKIVEPSLGFTHHYRSRVTQRTMKKHKGTPGIPDDTVMVYADRLIGNVQKQLKTLGLDPY